MLKKCSRGENARKRGDPSRAVGRPTGGYTRSWRGRRKGGNSGGGGSPNGALAFLCLNPVRVCPWVCPMIPGCGSVARGCYYPHMPQPKVLERQSRQLQRPASAPPDGGASSCSAGAGDAGAATTNSWKSIPAKAIDRSGAIAPGAVATPDSCSWAKSHVPDDRAPRVAAEPPSSAARSRV